MGKTFLSVLAVAGLLTASGAGAAPVVLNPSFENWSSTSGSHVGNVAPLFSSLFTNTIDSVDLAVDDWFFPPSSPAPVFVGISNEQGTAGGGLNAPIPTPDGGVVAHMVNGGFFEQSMAGFDAGQLYVVSFSAAGRLHPTLPGLGPTPMEVSVGGTPLVFSGSTTVTPVEGSYSVFTSDAFTVTAGAHTLRFEGLTLSGDKTTFVDAVSITEVPEPSSIMLLSLGLIGMMGSTIGRRR